MQTVAHTEGFGNKTLLFTKKKITGPIGPINYDIFPPDLWLHNRCHKEPAHCDMFHHCDVCFFFFAKRFQFGISAAN
jgi:hypothetical protein